MSALMLPENPSGPQVRAWAAYCAALTISVDAAHSDGVWLDEALERRAQLLAGFITGPQDAPIEGRS